MSNTDPISDSVSQMFTSEVGTREEHLVQAEEILAPDSTSVSITVWKISLQALKFLSKKYLGEILLLVKFANPSTMNSNG